MPGPKETAPTRGAASSPLPAGYHSDQQAQVTSPAVEPPTLEDLASYAAGQRFPNDLVRVVHERSEARQRSIERQRRDARDAVKRTPTRRLTADEIKIQRETAMLYARVTALVAAGKIRWDPRKSDWVKRPVFTRTDRSRPPVYTSDELLDKFDRVRRNGKRWSARCPAHDDKTPSLAIAEGERAWLLRCWTGCTFDEITHAAGLESQRMFFS